MSFGRTLQFFFFRIQRRYIWNIIISKNLLYLVNRVSYHSCIWRKMYRLSYIMTRMFRHSKFYLRYVFSYRYQLLGTSITVSVKPCCFVKFNRLNFVHYTNSFFDRSLYFRYRFFQCKHRHCYCYSYGLS